MRLKCLELTGFKSFARRSVFEFTTSMTGVVGPNGAGKSNIAEALRFVLGEQSMKSLRSKRGEDLIWNGSSSVPRLNRAQVTVTFDNTDRAFNLDYDEVEIQRIVWRDGTNQYLLNGSPVRLKDIFELLASVHIGASSHEIISQGEADRILNAGMKERRSMIEDALGLKIYQYKRIESERKLMKTEENMGHVRALRQEIAPHLTFLEKQVEKLRHTEQLRAELKELYIVYLGHEELYFANERKGVEQEEETPQRALKETEGAEVRVEGLLRASEREKEAGSSLRKLEEQLNANRDAKDEISRNLGRLEGALEYETRRRKTISQAVEVETVLVELSALKTFREEVRELFSKSEKIEEVASLKAIVKDIYDHARRFWEHYALHKKETAPPPGEISESEYAELERKKKEAEDALARVTREEKRLRDEYIQWKEAVLKGEGEWRALEKELFELRTRKNELLTRLQLVAVRAEKIKGEEEYWKREVEEAKLHSGKDIRELAQKAMAGKENQSETRLEQEKRRRAIERLKIKIEETDGGGEEVTKEYEEVRERDQFLLREIGDLEKSAASLKELIKDLKEKIDTEFKEGVASINKHFQEFFTLMFGGGSASIKIIAPPQKKRKGELREELEEDEMDDREMSENPEEGIDVTVSLPTKKIKGLQALSGGERALTSIALIFSTVLVHTPPFFVLDETDAALDEANSRKFSALLERLSKKTQFIVITHNRETMGKAEVLYGVTSTSDGISRVLSIQLEKAVEIAE